MAMMVERLMEWRLEQFPFEKPQTFINQQRLKITLLLLLWLQSKNVPQKMPHLVFTLQGCSST